MNQVPAKEAIKALLDGHIIQEIKGIYATQYRILNNQVCGLRENDIQWNRFHFTLEDLLKKGSFKVIERKVSNG